jgi:hypothetical protein
MQRLFARIVPKFMVGEELKLGYTAFVNWQTFLTCAFGIGGISLAKADVLFYSGDLGPNSSYHINSNPMGSAGYISELFELTERSAITALFTHQISITPPPFCEYEIRRGVSEGLGGVELLHGFAVQEFIPTGRFSPLGYPEHRYTVRFDPFFLDPGVYAFSVRAQDFSDVATTDGTNGIGLLVGDQTSYGLSIFSQWNWSNFHADHSMGVEGYVVPEPATLAVFGILVLGFAKRRPRKPTKPS